MVLLSLGDERVQADWARFNAESPTGSIFTSEIWLNAFRNFPEHDIKLVVLPESGPWICALPLFIKTKRFFRTALPPPATPYFGFLFSSSALGVSKKEAAENQRAIEDETLRMVHYAEIPSAPGIRLDPSMPWEVEQRSTYFADPRSRIPETELRKGVRYELRKARELGIRVEYADEPEPFFELLVKMCHAKGIALPLPRGVFLSLARELHHQGRMRIYFAKQGMANAAGAVIIFDARSVYYWLAAANPEFRRTGASYLLLHEILGDLADKATASIDLVGANVHSVARFKAHFASRTESYPVLKGFSSKYARLARQTYQRIRGVEML